MNRCINGKENGGRLIIVVRLLSRKKQHYKSKQRSCKNKRLLFSSFRAFFHRCLSTFTLAFS